MKHYCRYNESTLGLILIISILAIAGVFRLCCLQLAEFKWDECTVSLEAIRIAKGLNFPCIGLLSSKYVYMPPFFIYLMAIPYFFSNDPVVATFFVAFLNVLAVGACYFFCRRLFDREIAGICALLFAVSPWAVLFSRKIWPQDVLPLFSIAFFYSLYLVLKIPKSKAILPAVLILGLLPGFHLTAAVFFLIFFISIILVFPRINWLYLFLGILLVFVIYFPYLRHEYLYDKGDWINLMHRQGSMDFGGITGSLKIIAYEGFSISTGTSMSGRLLISILKFIFFLGFFSTAVSVLEKYGIKKEFPYFYVRFNIHYLLIFLWYSIPILVFYIKAIEDYAFYFILLYPVQFIIIAIGFRELWKILCLKSNAGAIIPAIFFLAVFAISPFAAMIVFVCITAIRSFKLHKKIIKINIVFPYLLSAILLSIVIYEIYFIYGAFQRVRTNGGDPGDYGVSIECQKNAVDYILNSAKDWYAKYGYKSSCEVPLVALSFWRFLKPEEEYPFINPAEMDIKYKVDVDFDKSINFIRPDGFISYKYFGPLRVVLEKANENI